MARARSSYAVRRLLLPVQEFVHTETTSGIVLLAAAVSALVWANSRWGSSYEAFWNTIASVHVGPWAMAHTIREWINDALMVVFFFVVGLEVKREVVHGELSDRRSAALPGICALGGMIVPALLYLGFNYSGAGARGWGIPMATDIAFALGVLALAGKRVSASLRIFLLTLATVDDIGAILIIALFYTEKISGVALAAAFVLLAAIVLMRKAGVQDLLLYVPVALLFWFAILESGIHATIAGVVLGLVAPTRPHATVSSFFESTGRLLTNIRGALSRGERQHAEAMLGEMEEMTIATEPPADRLLRLLHPFSSYLVLPLFALANAGIALTAVAAQQAVSSPATRGIVVGLILGKVTGIVGFGYLAIRFRLATLMSGVPWWHLIGVGLLGGMGFTVSLFMTDLAFSDASIIAQAKLGVLVASLIAGIAGYLTLRATGARPTQILHP